MIDKDGICVDVKKHDKNIDPNELNKSRVKMHESAMKTLSMGKNENHETINEGNNQNGRKHNSGNI
jgi:hypothetical protein